ncbi:MAG: recombination protein NinB [Zoogloeaceae bacterium]|jgi:phosphoserine aminotransferase|nr:recombination protein NinB [Zoogloeaceae bacterium]
MMKHSFVLAHPQARRGAVQAVLSSPDGYRVAISPPGRNLDQNAAMWALLGEFSRKLEWPVNGRLEKLAPEEWKDILTAAFRREVTRVAMGLDGGMVLLGARTSKFTKREMSDFLEFLHSVATERGVVIEPPVLEAA